MSHNNLQEKIKGLENEIRTDLIEIGLVEDVNFFKGDNENPPNISYKLKEARDMKEIEELLTKGKELRKHLITVITQNYLGVVEIKRSKEEVGIYRENLILFNILFNDKFLYELLSTLNKEIKNYKEQLKHA